jgi:hypothetical protein
VLAQPYFRLAAAIAAARTDAELAALAARLAATAMPPFEYRALERRIRARELALLDLEGL